MLIQALNLDSLEEMDNLIKDMENEDIKETKTSLNIQSLCKNIDFEEVKEASPKKNNDIFRPFKSS